MGLLDGNLGGEFGPSLLSMFGSDSFQNLSANLLAGQSPNFGVNVGNALLANQAYNLAHQRSERENRQAELQQLSGFYKILKDEDQRAFFEAQLPGSAPYRKNPQLAAVEMRLGNLVGAPPLVGSRSAMPAGLLGGNPPLGSAMLDAPSLPPAQASQYSVAVRPEFQAQGPMPSAASQQQPDLGMLLKAANIPLPVAQALIREGKYEDLQKAIIEALKPHNGPGGISRINPLTGAVELLGGSATPGQVPWTLQNGVPRATPIQGAAEEVARAEGLKAGAVESAKAPYSFGTYNVGPGGAPKVMSVQSLLESERGSVPQLPSPGYTGRSPDDEARRILAQELRDNPNDPALRREIQLRFPDLLQGNGLTGINPIAAKSAEEFNADFVKNAYRPTMDTAKQADTILSRVSALQRNGILDKTGWGTTQKAYAANVLGAFGVKDAAAYASDAQTFRKFMMDYNWELLNAAKGVQTEGDSKRAMETFASLGNTPQANKFVLDFTAATAKLAKDKAAFYSDRAQQLKGGGDLQSIEAEWFNKGRSIYDYPEMQKWAGKQASTSGTTITLPNGQQMRFPSEAALRAFKQQAGLQ